MSFPNVVFPEPRTTYDQGDESQFRREVTRSFQEINQHMQSKEVTGTPSALASGSTHDYAIGSDTSIARLATNASGSTLTGIVATKTERRVTVLNLGSGTLTLANENAGSIAQNRFTIGIGADLVLKTNERAELLYDPVSQRWRIGSGTKFRGVRAYRASTAFGLTDGVAAAIQWNAEAHDTDSYHDNSTNPSRFTIPTGLGGVQRIGFMFSVQDTGTGLTGWEINMEFKKNGSVVSGSQLSAAGSIAPTGDYVPFGGSIDIEAAAADYLELFVTAIATAGTPTWGVKVGSQMTLEHRG